MTTQHLQDEADYENALALRQAIRDCVKLLENAPEDGVLDDVQRTVTDAYNMLDSTIPKLTWVIEAWENQDIPMDGRVHR